jgi:tetratricopeptide (TPR) repeat protein
MTRPREVDLVALAEQRREAARLAFWQATTQAPPLWQGHYALALTQFTAIDPIKFGERLEEWDERRDVLEQVNRGCDQALRLRPPAGSRPVVEDLKGMANVWLADSNSGDRCLRRGMSAHRPWLSALRRWLSAPHRRGMRAHRKAVALSWRELCRAERLRRAKPAAAAIRSERVQQARANATVTLHDLALAHGRRATLAGEHGRGDYWIANRLFRTAVYVARPCIEREIASRADRAMVLEHKGDALRVSRAQNKRDRQKVARVFTQAAEAYEEASERKPTKPQYAAKRARALAKAAALQPTNADEVKRQIDKESRNALRELAPAFRQPVEPLTSSALRAHDDETLTALRDAYQELPKACKDQPSQHSERMVKLCERLQTLWREIQDAHRLLAQPKGNRASRQQRCDSLKTSIDNLKKARKRWKSPKRHQPLKEDMQDHDLGEQCRQLARDQIDICLAQLNATGAQLGADGCSWENAEELLSGLIHQLEQRARTDRERIVDFHLRAEYARALRHTNHAGHQKDALHEIVESVRADPLSIEGYREAGKVHYGLGQYDEALRSWNLALGIDPNDAYAHLNIAICHRQVAMCYPRFADAGHNGDTDRQAALSDAAEHLATALALFAGEDVLGAVWARAWAGRVALDRGRIGESVAILIGALDDQLDDLASAAAWLFLGEARLANHEVRLAETAFDRCEAILPEFAGEPKLTWVFQLPALAMKCRVKCGRAIYTALSKDDQEYVDPLAAAARYAQDFADKFPNNGFQFELAAVLEEARLLQSATSEDGTWPTPE